METLLLIATFLALVGAYLNANGNKYGFLIWIMTNTVFMWHNFAIGQWQQGLLFMAYLFLALLGFVKLSKSKGNK